jgi:hypothetical protein
MDVMNINAKVSAEIARQIDGYELKHTESEKYLNLHDETANFPNMDSSFLESIKEFTMSKDSLKGVEALVRAIEK